MDKDQMKTLQESLDKGAERMKSLEERQAKLDAYLRERRIGLDGTDPKGKQFFFSRAIAGIATGDWKGREFERDELQRGAQIHRDMGFGSTNAGAEVVPPEYIATLIDALVAKTVVLASGATQLTGLTRSPVTMPKKTSSGTAYWRAENNDGTESALGTDEVSLTPKTLMALVPFSNELMMLSNPKIEQMVKDDLTGVLARALDLAALEGGATGATDPISGVQDFGTAHSIGAAPDFDDLLDMLNKLELANADEGSIGWIMHPRDLHTLRKIKDSDGQYLLQPIVSESAKWALWGYPVRTSTQLDITVTTTDSRIFFANWADLLWAMWGTMSLEASREAEDYWKKNQTGVRAVMYCDIASRHDESFIVGTGVTA